MLHTIPEEYTKDQHLITLYNTAFKEGYYDMPILDDSNFLKMDEIDDEQAKRIRYEKQVKAIGRRAGELKRMEVGK